jgi:hypothetical protein
MCVDVGAVQNVNITIDSGADNVSMIHMSVFNRLPQDQQARLVPTKQHILNADGKRMDVLGSVVLPFTICNM